MIENFFKIAWRNLLKDRQFTFLNLAGLAIGLASALMIWLWISDELSVDKYNSKDASLYQVMSNIKNDDGTKTIEGTPGPLGEALANEIPEIASAVTVLRASWFPFQGIISNADNNIKAGGQYIGKDYFKIFNCEFLDGDKDKIVTDKYSVAISDVLAKKLFNSTSNVIGKTIKWAQQEFTGSYIIAGVFKKTPANATDQFDLMLNYDLVPEKREGLKQWGNSDPSTYVLVKEGTNINLLNEKIKDFVKKKNKDAGQEIFLTKFSDKYLYGNYENGIPSGGRIAYIRLFSIIAIFILIIACINFMNLATAKASRRAKEVGIQKVVGARKGAIIVQYLCESMLLVFLSLILSVFIILLLLPVFNSITGKQIVLQPDARLILSVLGITLLTGLLAGSYPALYLSSFKPVTVLKGKLKTSLGELWARKGLVVFQFTISVAFIASVLVIYRQVQYIQSKNLGYSRDHVIHFEIPLEMDSAQISRAISFVGELRNIPGVVSASSYYHNLTGEHGAISGFEWPGKNPNNDIEFSNLEVGYGFVKTAGIKLVQGRDFSTNDNSSREIIFNESAIRAMGLKDPVGKMIKFWGQERQIIGIAGDFNFESLYHNIRPCFIQEYPVMPNIMVKIQKGNEQAVLDKISKVYGSFVNGMAFEYRYLDEDYQALYASETKVGILTRYFAGLAIIISCLGLFGLAAFTAQRRQKEIGIRKVVGASASSVAFLLSKDFLKLVLIAIIIAFPIVWWAMQNWLNGFAYRVNISADIFIVTAFATVIVTLFAVSFQSIRAAMMNPVKSLRNE